MQAPNWRFVMSLQASGGRYELLTSCALWIAVIASSIVSNAVEFMSSTAQVAPTMSPVCDHETVGGVLLTQVFWLIVAQRGTEKKTEVRAAGDGPPAPAMADAPAGALTEA